MQQNQIIFLLKWYIEAEADEIIAKKPINRLKKNKDSSIKDNVNTSKLDSNEQVSEKLSNCKNLDEIKVFIENFDGCPLKYTAKNLVFGTGNKNAKIMLIGEAPGAEEDITGIPFTGQSGKLLDLMLKSIGLDRNELYITNIIHWRPPGNRTPNNVEIKTMLPFIKRQIELVSPRLIILIGGIAANSILQKNEGITKIRGNWFNFEKIAVIPIFHPSYLLRNPSLKNLAWKDMLSIKNKIEKV